jgi:hypothetical protein
MITKIRTTVPIPIYMGALCPSSVELRHQTAENVLETTASHVFFLGWPWPLPDFDESLSLSRPA